MKSKKAKFTHAQKTIKNKCIRHYTEIKTSYPLAYFRTLFKEFRKTQSSSLTVYVIRIHIQNTLTPSCFRMKKRRFLSLDMNISLKQHKDTYGFHKGDLVEQTRSTQISEHSLQLSPRKPIIISFKHSEETINSLKAIHFTNTQVYEYFPDWFRSGSLNSPITQVSIKLDRFIPFKVLQLVCIRKKTYPDAHLCMVKTTIPWHQQHSSASVVLRDNMLIKPANRAKRT